MRRLLVEWHYKFDCPYCDRFERYVLNPLEEMGYINVIRVPLSGIFYGPAITRNVMISEFIEGRTEVSAPVLIDVSGKTRAYFVPFSPEPGAAVEDSVRVMAENFINHLSRVLNINPEEITREPRIRKALMLDDGVGGKEKKKRKLPKIWGR